MIEMKVSNRDVIAEAVNQWSTHWGKAPLPSMEAVTSLMRAQQILLQRLNGLLREHDLTFPRYEALMIIYLSRRGALPLGKLGERLQVHATSVTNLIDGLERAGFVHICNVTEYRSPEGKLLHADALFRRKGT